MQNLRKQLLPIVMRRDEARNNKISKEIDGTDLAAVIGLQTESGLRSIRQEDLQALLMTKEEIIKQATKNLRDGGYDLQPLSDVVGGYDPTHTLVLTRKDGKYGAAEILNKEALAEAGERIGSYIIVPSSRHELLLVPREADFTADDLRRTLQFVNQSIPADDRLSEQVYGYSFAEKKITMPERNENQTLVSNQETTHINRGR